MRTVQLNFEKSMDVDMAYGVLERSSIEITESDNRSIKIEGSEESIGDALMELQFQGVIPKTSSIQ